MTGTDEEFDQALTNAKYENGSLRATTNYLGQTALHLGVVMPKRLEKLLQAGIDPDAVDYGGSTPLMYAACYGKSNSVLRLIEYGAKPGLVDQRNRRVFLDYAIRRKHLHVIVDLVQFLRNCYRSPDAMFVLDRCLCYHFSRNPDGWDISVSKRLFELGADPDVRCGGSSLMHLAKSESEVRMLLDAGFTAVNRRDGDGVMPFMSIMSLFDHESADRLLSQGACVNSQDSVGWTALHHTIGGRSSGPNLLYMPGIEEDKSWRFGRRAQMISCLHLSLRHGADFSLHDNCKCPCSSNGCSATTIALHQTSAGVHSLYLRSTLSGFLIDFFCAFQNRNEANLKLILDDVVRYQAFCRSEVEHSCCRGKSHDDFDITDLSHRSCNKGKACDVAYANFNGRLNGNSNDGSSMNDRIIKELAHFYHDLESCSLETCEAAISQGRKVS